MFRSLALLISATLAVKEDDFRADRRDYSHLPDHHAERHYLVLGDDNFEHETQATTGSTTGDWLLLFCEVRHVALCRELLDTWDSLYHELYGRVNVAYIDV
jgi:hypothetical protein